MSSISSGLIDNFGIYGFNSGRGSFSAVTKQIYTKFGHGVIKKISAKTFGKMLSVSLYGGVMGTTIESDIQHNLSKNELREAFI